MSTNPNIGIVPRPTLGQRLRIARELTGLEQQEFAKEIGTSRQTIGAAERGTTKPRLIVIRAWAMRTGVDAHWLETGEAPSPDGGDGASLESRLRESNSRPIHYEYMPLSLVAA